MDINDNNTVIEFKSTSDNYKAEHCKAGARAAKRNTTRFFKPHEHARMITAQETLEWIRITNTKTGESFVRMLTDFREYKGEGIANGYHCWIFSW